MPRSKREVSEVGKNQNASDFFTCAGSYRMLLSCRGRGPPPGRRSRRARAAGRRSCPRRARPAAARCRPTPRMASAPARMRSPWRVVLSLFLFFPLAEGGRRSCSWRSAAAGEGRERRAKASAGRPLVVEIDGEKEATSKRGEWSAPRRKKKERQKTEETKTGKKNVSLSPHSARHNSIFFSTFLPSLPRPFTPRRRYAKTAGGVHATCSPLRGCRAGRPRSKVADSGGKGGGELPFEDWLLWIQESKLLLSCFSSSSAARRHRPATAAGLPARVPALPGGLRAGPSLAPASV